MDGGGGGKGLKLSDDGFHNEVPCRSSACMMQWLVLTEAMVLLGGSARQHQHLVPSPHARRICLGTCCALFRTAVADGATLLPLRGNLECCAMPDRSTESAWFAARTDSDSFTDSSDWTPTSELTEDDKAK